MSNSQATDLWKHFYVTSIDKDVQLKCVDLEKFQRDTVDSDAETADEAEPTEVVDSEASTEDEATTSRQGELLKNHRN